MPRTFEVSRTSRRDRVGFSNRLDLHICTIYCPAAVTASNFQVLICSGWRDSHKTNLYAPFRLAQVVGTLSSFNIAIMRTHSSLSTQAGEFDIPRTFSWIMSRGVIFYFVYYSWSDMVCKLRAIRNYIHLSIVRWFHATSTAVVTLLSEQTNHARYYVNQVYIIYFIHVGDTKPHHRDCPPV